MRSCRFRIPGSVGKDHPGLPPAREGPIFPGMSRYLSGRPRIDSRVLAFGILTLLASWPSPARGQDQPTLVLGGEIRPRLLARTPVEGKWDHWISMRSRLDLGARFQEGLALFLQIQDVRFWGEELTNRDRSADAVDFHQAYLEVDSLPGIGGKVRVGRQEVTLAQGRFLAAPNWGQAGQTFDGLKWSRFLGPARLELVYLRLQEGSSAVHDVTADLSAAWLVLPAGAFGAVELLALHDRSGGQAGTGQSTAGAIWKLDRGRIGLVAQGMGQVGERQGRDVSAFMLAVQGRMEILEDRGSVTLWLDHLSGDEDPFDEEIQAFSTLFGARHRFYGRADYFRDIPEDTRGLGLQDLALKLALTPAPSVSVNLDLHAFRTARRGNLSSHRLAEEIDLWIRYRFREALNLETGYTLTFGGPAMEELDLLDGTGQVGYVMTSLRF